MPGAPRTNPAAPRGAQADLAARLRQGASALQDRLNRRDTLIELIRSVNATLDPQKVAEALLGHAQGWFPARVPGRGRAGRIAACRRSWPSADPATVRRRSRTRRPLDHRAQRRIHDREPRSRSARVRGPRRRPSSGFPLRCRARTIGALIALDPAPSSDAPTLPRRADVCAADRARRPGARARHDAASPARRGAVGHRRSDEPLQLAVS